MINRKSELQEVEEDFETEIHVDIEEHEGDNDTLCSRKLKKEIGETGFGLVWFGFMAYQPL